MADLFERIICLRIEKKERHQFFLLFSFSMFLIGAYFIKNDVVFSFGKTLFLTLGAFLSPYCPICMAVLCEPFSFQQGVVFSLYQELIISIPIILSFIINKPKNKQVCLLVTCFVAMLASLLLGNDARITTFVIHCLLLCVSFAIFSKNNINIQRLIVFSFVAQGLITSIIVLIQLASGEQTLLWETRLTFDGSVRNLSNPLAISCFFLLIVLFTLKKKRILSRIIVFSLLILEITLLIITYSRGVLVSLSLAFFIFLLFRKSSFASKVFILCVFGVVLAFILSSLNLDSSFMMQGLETGSGRTEIWLAFFSKMFSDGMLRVLFGYGPGDSSRVLEGTVFSGYYSHSVYVDYLVSFGFFGGVLLAIAIIGLFCLVFRTKDCRLFALFFLTVLMFFSHGNFASLDFHILLALCGSLAGTKLKQSVVNQTVFIKRTQLYEWQK